MKEDAATGCDMAFDFDDAMPLQLIAGNIRCLFRRRLTECGASRPRCGADLVMKEHRFAGHGPGEGVQHGRRENIITLDLDVDCAALCQESVKQFKDEHSLLWHHVELVRCWCPFPRPAHSN